MKCFFILISWPLMALSLLILDDNDVGYFLFFVSYLLRGDIDKDVLVNIMEIRSKSIFMLIWLIIFLVFVVCCGNKFHSYNLLMQVALFLFPMMLEMFVGDVKRCVLHRESS